MIHLKKSRLAALVIAVLGCLGLVAAAAAGLPSYQLLTAMALVALLSTLALRSELRGELLCLRVDKNQLLLAPLGKPTDMKLVEIYGFWDLSPWLIYLQLRCDSRNQPVFIWRDSCSEEERRRLRRLLHAR